MFTLIQNFNVDTFVGTCHLCTIICSKIPMFTSLFYNLWFYECSHLELLEKLRLSNNKYQTGKYIYCYYSLKKIFLIIVIVLHNSVVIHYLITY